MFNLFFGKGRRRGFHRKHRVHRRRGSCGSTHPLSDFVPGVEVTVVSNSDRKTLEMGLCTGAAVRIIENRPGDANIVIAVGEGRYILARETAGKIRVR